MENRLKQWIAGIVLALLIGLAIYVFVVVDTNLLLQNPGVLAKVVFVLLVILEVIVAPIPGGLIALLAAATWGFWQAWPLQYIGNVIGGIIVFTLARNLGRPFVDEHVNTKAQKRVEKWLFGRPYLIWLVYAVPVFPIDTISIVLGVSKLRFRTYVLIILTALPFYTGITAAVGAYFGDYIPFLEYFSTATFVLFGVAIVYLIWKLRKRSIGSRS